MLLNRRKSNFDTRGRVEPKQGEHFEAMRIHFLLTFPEWHIERKQLWFYFIIFIFINTFTFLQSGRKIGMLVFLTLRDVPHWLLHNCALCSPLRILMCILWALTSFLRKERRSREFIPYFHSFQSVLPERSLAESINLQVCCTFRLVNESISFSFLFLKKCLWISVDSWWLPGLVYVGSFS